MSIQTLEHRDSGTPRHKGTETQGHMYIGSQAFMDIQRLGDAKRQKQIVEHESLWVWCIPVIIALVKLRQEYQCEFKVILG